MYINVRAELLQLVTQTAEIQVHVRSISLHREQLCLTSLSLPHLDISAEVPRVDPTHRQAVSTPHFPSLFQPQSRVVVAHHRRHRQQVVNLSLIHI